MNSLKLFLHASAVVGLCALSGQGWAACNIRSATTAREVAIGTLSVPPDATVGTLLKTVEVSESDYTKISCLGSIYLIFQYGPDAGRSAITGPGIPTGVVSSGVDGIGVRVSFADSWVPIATLPGAAGFKWINNDIGGAIRFYTAPRSTIEFYKTGNIVPGELLFPRHFVEFWASTSPTSTLAAEGVIYSTLNISDTPEVKVPGCVTPSLTVPLGKHAKSDFSGVGSTSASTPFTFAINNCSEGLNAVKYTFKPASGITLEDSGLATQHLTVKSGPGTASGIGVQVMYNNDTLVPFNTAIGTTAGSHTIPMKARYIQTASAISAGDANSALEFTMTYQ